MKKALRDTKVGEFLQSKGFTDVINIAGAAIPGVSLLNSVKDLVLGHPKWKELPGSLQEEFLKLHADALQELDLILQDVQNARSREIEIAKTGRKDWMMSVVIIVALVLFISLLAVDIFIPGSQTLVEPDMRVTIRDCFYIVIVYFLGSSRGSKQKTDLLNQK
jgi:hypothetical protein